jgi:hypothetical protein
MTTNVPGLSRVATTPSKRSGTRDQRQLRAFGSIDERRVQLARQYERFALRVQQITAHRAQ